MATRTGVLFRFAGSGAFNILATVPAGQTWILKDLVVSNETGGAAVCFLYSTDPGGTVHGGLLNESVGANSVTRKGMFHVLGPGDFVWFASSGGVNVYVWGSGAKLPGVAP